MGLHNFRDVLLNNKLSTSIITKVKIVFYFKNVSEKITFYEEFEGQNTATDRLCDVCFDRY